MSLMASSVETYVLVSVPDRFHHGPRERRGGEAAPFITGAYDQYNRDNRRPEGFGAQPNFLSEHPAAQTEAPKK